MANANTQDLLTQRELAVRDIMHQAATLQAAAHSQVRSRTEIMEWAIFGVFVAGLAWVPYLWGSNGLEAWDINAVLFPGIAIAYELSLLVRGASHPVAIREFWVSAALLAAVVLWILVQNATWTPASWHHPIWEMSTAELQVPVAGSISVNRDLTTLAFLRLITSASVFWVSVQLCRNRSRANLFVISIVCIIAAYSAYGLAMFALSPGHLLSWMDGHRFLASTFYNRNHFAAYAGMGLILACGLILRLYRRADLTGGVALSFKIARFIEVTGYGSVLFAVAFLILASMLLTGSRGGLVATAIGLLTFCVLWVQGVTTSSLTKIAILVFGLLFMAGAFYAFGNMLVDAIRERGVEDQRRWAVALITLRSIFALPLFGYGYGTFPDVFPMFRDRTLELGEIWAQAHNTYLEIWQGLGLVFGTMLIGSVLILVLRCLRGFMNQRGGTVPAVAVGATALVGVHALVDFSLQIQAVTLTYMALLGAGVAQAIDGSRKPVARQKGALSHPSI